MSKDINYKKFDLSEIQWNKIKGGITKEEFCKGDKRLERIFDALDSDNVKGRLSGFEKSAFFLLTGKHAFEHSGKINDKTIDAFMRKNTLACAAILSPDKKTGTINFNSNAENIELTLGTYHSYTVAGADENNVYLINPWNTVIPITLTREEFKKSMGVR